MIDSIIIDLDGVVFNTIQKIVEIYNTDHAMYKNFTPVSPGDIKTWRFEELDLESAETIDKYFDTPRFFQDIPLMQSAEWIIKKLSFDYNIIFCSAGSYPNLQLKRLWLRKHFPFAEFIPIEYPENKSIVDMYGCIQIDDRADNLEMTNADIKICYGNIYKWNESWKGDRCRSWVEIYQYIKEKTDRNV